ncbi:MAG: DUF4340 domain-containing protein [Cyclobacteriaceae bacterium]
MKKLNNKILIAVLLALVGLFAASRFFRSGRLETNLPAELMAVDTSAVTEILVYPNAEKNQEVKLVRNGGQWLVKMGDRSSAVEKGSVSGAIGYFTHLKPMRLITRNQSRWNEFSVGDTSTRVKFMKGADVLADVRIGRIGFNQQPGQQQFNPGGIFTHVRLSDDKAVYAVEGFLESAFNRPYNDWRDKTLLRLSASQVTRISFRYPADSSFVLEKREKKWWLGSQQADSTKVKSFLSGLEYKNASEFAEDFKPNGEATARLELTGPGGAIGILEAWKREADWVIRSSQQPDVLFGSRGIGFEQLMQGKKKFLQSR